MNIDLITSADAVGMFCRLHMNAKRDIPIRPSEMGVLIYTQKQINPVTPLMISQFFKITKPSVTQMVNNLVKLNYLIKEPSVKDKRSYILRITHKGTDLVEQTFEEYFKSIELLKDKMGEGSFMQLIELIQMANSILEEDK
ncbi:MAG: transcriptional regulator, MarR family [Herbinix sp.]|jgi:DNA-binding MarR family transcriptional regulator|nr:transcriptional regulator, MarR family [Herbinix sp.]